MSFLPLLIGHAIFVYGIPILLLVFFLFIMYQIYSPACLPETKGQKVVRNSRKSVKEFTSSYESQEEIPNKEEIYKEK